MLNITIISTLAVIGAGEAFMRYVCVVIQTLYGFLGTVTLSYMELVTTDV